MNPNESGNECNSDSTQVRAVTSLKLYLSKYKSPDGNIPRRVILRDSLNFIPRVAFTFQVSFYWLNHIANANP